MQSIQIIAMSWLEIYLIEQYVLGNSLTSFPSYAFYFLPSIFFNIAGNFSQDMAATVISLEKACRCVDVLVHSRKINLILSLNFIIFFFNMHIEGYRKLGSVVLLSFRKGIYFAQEGFVMEKFILSLQMHILFNFTSLFLQTYRRVLVLF